MKKREMRLVGSEGGGKSKILQMEKSWIRVAAQASGKVT